MHKYTNEYIAIYVHGTSGCSFLYGYLRQACTQLQYMAISIYVRRYAWQKHLIPLTVCASCSIRIVIAIATTYT